MSNIKAVFLTRYALWCFALSLLVPVAILSASQSPTPVPPAGQLVRVEYDSNKNLTQVSMNPFILASRKLEELRLGAVAGYPGKIRSKPNEIVLIFLSLSHTDENRYDAARKLTVFADGQRLDWGETQHSKQSQNGLFIETMMARVPMDDFLLVSKARQVKLKLGLTEVELSEPQIKILRVIASYLTE